MKQLLSRRFVASFLFLVVCTISWAYDFEKDGIFYNINADGVSVSVTYKTSNSYSGSIIIPSKVSYDGITYNVTSIGDYSFYDCYALTSVTMSESVTSIGDCAFYYCSGLTSIIIPNSVTSIGERAFFSCRGLISVIIGNNVTSIGNYAFYYCTSLISVTIPNNVTSIGEWAFNGCSGLTSLTIGGSIASIGTNAFDNCSTLTSIKVEGSNTTFDSRDNCNAIIETSTNTLVLGCKSTAIPNSVTSIGQSSFSGCSGLTTLTIPNSVTSIEDYAFWQCSSLTSVVIPNNVTSIGEGAFRFCNGLTSVSIPESVTSIGRNAFDATPWYNNQPDGLVYAGNVAYKYKGTMPEGTHITLNEGTLGITAEAFYNCTGLTSVTIPSSVFNIGNDVFIGCTGLMSVILNTNYIVSETYTSSSNLKKIFGSQVTEYILGDDIKSIGNYAFYKCNSLRSVTIGKSVTNIGDKAFSRCNSLKSVTLNSNSIVSATRTSSTSMKSIFGEQVEEYIIGNNVKSIGNYAFYGCSSLDIINSNIKDIRNVNVRSYSFDGIPANAKLYVPKGQRQYYAKNSSFDQFRFIWEKETVRIDDIGKLSNGKVYCLEPEDARRGIVYTGDGSDYLDACGGIYNNPDVVINDAEPNQQFAIYKHNGKYYLYSIGQKKFVSNYETVGSNVFFKLDSKPNQAITINQSSVDGEFIFVVGDKEWINVTSRTYGCVGNWEIEDGGNRISIIEAGNISPESLREIKQAFGETKDGDANGNGVVEIGDVTSVLTLMATPEATGYNNKAADANGNGEIEIGDVTTILTIMAGN